tara:strand:+ start:781 stop:1857 length:1077 start_codon:yes stop_codon:yes gene_type:complete
MADIDDLYNKIKNDNDEIFDEEDKKSDCSDDKEISINYYKILGVNENAKMIDIKKAYKKKLRLYHPDKVEKTTDNKIKYKLIREAGEILTNERKRKAYDFHKDTADRDNDFFSQKDSFKDFIKLQESKMSEEDRKISKLRFEEEINKMNNKHGFNEKETKPIDINDYNQKLEDMLLSREQEEIDFEHKDIFKGKSFDNNQFNKLFEKKKKIGKNNGMMTKIDDYTSFNDSELNNFSGIDNNELYMNDNKNMDAGFIDNNSEISFESDDEEYNMDDKITSSELDAMMKKMVEERNNEDDEFGNMGMDGYKSVMDDDKFNISSQLGFMVGNSTAMKGDQNFQKSRKKNKKTIKAYKELME